MSGIGAWWNGNTPSREFQTGCSGSIPAICPHSGPPPVVGDTVKALVSATAQTPRQVLPPPVEAGHGGPRLGPRAPLELQLIIRKESCLRRKILVFRRIRNGVLRRPAAMPSKAPNRKLLSRLYLGAQLSAVLLGGSRSFSRFIPCVSADAGLNVGQAAAPD